MHSEWTQRLREVYGDDLHIRELPARPAVTIGIPDWIDPRITNALKDAGVTSLWPHQRDALDIAYSGQNVVIATGTASGKSLCYQIPIAQAVLAEPKARALYLAPTKALARDQVRALNSLNIPGLVVAPYDGDSSQVERKFAREHANVLVTNPDMMHHSLMPGHERWHHMLKHLQVIAVDECHLYRGMFGAHVSNVLRRLLRVAVLHGANPQIVMASATVSSPAKHAQMLTDCEFVEVTVDGSPRGHTTVALALPRPSLPNENDGEVIRRSAVAEAADALTDLVAAKVRTLVFVRSRKAAETVAAIAREKLADVDASLPGTVTSYRAGYLAEERREVERKLRTGEVLGVASTNALELGVDISGLDATVMAGWPGSLASFWQQVGRAGRAGQDAVALMIASDNPMDHYLVSHPERVLDAPVESSVCDPANPNVLRGHLACAAAESHLKHDELARFGDRDRVLGVLAELAGDGLVREREGGWFWNSNAMPHADVDIRGAAMEPYRIVVGSTGQLVGTIDADAAFRQVHEGAIYLHLGESFLVEKLDIDHSTALVEAADVDYSTYSRSVTSVEVIDTLEKSVWGEVVLHKGTVTVTERVVGYQRRRNLTSQIIADIPLEMPPVTLRTQAMWLTAPISAFGGAHVGDIAGAVHAAEHAAIGMLPLFTLCDRNDIGGASLVEHPDTEMPTIFIYDGYAGGAGFAHHGYDNAAAWLGATASVVAECDCIEGCPACVQSPKCGNGNNPLDKEGAAALLTFALAAAT